MPVLKRQYVAGVTPLLAEDLNALGVEAEKVRNISGPDVIVDSTGIHIRRPPLAKRQVVTVKITSAASGGGKYNGRVWLDPTADVAATGNLAASDLGTDPGADNALVLNLQEIGKSTHDLTTSPVVITHFIGRLLRTNSDGKHVVAINGIDWKNCPA